MKRKYALTMALMLSIVLFTSVALGAGPIAKTLQVYYRDIKIKVDGNIKDAGQQQPFIYNSTTYVPLRFVSETLGKTVGWDDSQNLITITDGAYSSETLKQQIAQKDNELLFLRNQQITMAREISDLKDELEKAKKEVKEKESSGKDFEDYLYDEYGDFGGMVFDFYVKETKSAVTLTIEVNKNRYKTQWNRLTKSKLERWLEDIYDDVVYEYPKLKFSGTIEDTYDDEVLVKLGESRSKLTVDYYGGSGMTDSSSRYYLEEDLYDYYGWGLDSEYGRNFGDLEVEFHVDVDDDWEDVEIVIEVNTRYYADEWDDIEGTSAAERWIRDIIDYTQGEYRGYYVDGTIEDHRGDTLATFTATSSSRVNIRWY